MRFRWLSTLVVALALHGAEPIRLHPENPRYYLFRGKPFLVVTSAEHYGALINLDFDYRKYFDTLARDGMRMTRFFTGLYREAPDSFNITRNTLAPAANRFLTPYRRTATPGALDGLAKWDLDQWNPDYFSRLHELVRYASERGILVQVTLFCTYYTDYMWEASPLHSRNNVNGLPEVKRTEVLTLRHPALVARQEAFVRKMVTELNGYDNVTYEICNEPYFHGVTLEWQHRIAELIAATEAKLPNRHLIARNVANFTEAVIEPHPAVSILHFHYARPPVAVAMNYSTNRLIGFDETGFDGTLDVPYRIQGWDFILAGGGHYNHLDYSFTVGHEDGTFEFPKNQPGGGGPELRRQLKTLIDFMEGFDFLRMKPRNELILGGIPEEASARLLAEDGRAYALYLHHGQVLRDRLPRYVVRTGALRATPVLNLPAGNYTARWWHPRDGRIEEPQTFEHPGGPCYLATPEYREDIALELRRR
jgi:hypothetical protein